MYHLKNRKFECPIRKTKSSSVPFEKQKVPVYLQENEREREKEGEKGGKKEIDEREMREKDERER